MKNHFILKFSLVLVLTCCKLIGFSQSYYDDGLKVLNPNLGNWTKTAGKFESIEITLTPAGNYTNIDILLEISAQNTNLALSSDSLEAEFKFSLPADAIIHDAKLWMNNIPVKAAVYERNKAKFIYESLVSRRIDPLIIYQNIDNSYEARIYPFINPDKRKLSISYLVPNTFTAKGIEVPLDLRMFRSDIPGQTPTINIKAINNSTLGSPIFLNGVVASVNGIYSSISILATQSNIFQHYAIYFSPVSSFFTTQATGANEGFYQLLLMPHDSIATTSKTTFVIDYATSNSITYNSLMTILKNKIKFSKKDNDLFNVVYAHNGAVLKLSNSWIACDSASVENAFATLPANLNSISSMYLPELQSAILFINANGAEGNIMMLSNAGFNGSNANFQNQLITSNLGLMTNNYPVFIFDFNTQFTYSLWNGSEYFYNNEYFFYNLAIASGGNYFSLRNGGSNNFYYNAISSFIDKLNSAFSAIKPQHTYDALTYNSNSVLHSEYQLKNKVIVPVGEAYMEVGKYINTPSSMVANYYYGIDSINHMESFTLTPSISLDTFSKKIWGSSFIDELIADNSNGIYTNTIINNSIQYDVLCEYTALLALEPDTAGTIINEIPLSTNEEKVVDNLEIKVYPNPFESTQYIECNFPALLYNKEWTVEVFTAQGQLLSCQKGNTAYSGLLKLEWYNNVHLDLNSGMYFIKITIGNHTKVVRVFKK